MSKPITLTALHEIKQTDGKIACVALYDAAMSHIAAQSGVEVIIVGDSLGMTIQGHANTTPVTLEHMIYHTQAVCNGNTYSWIVSDLPFMSYASPAQALNNAAKLMQAGANMVKLEGGEWLCETVYQLTERGIPVCTHLGLTPQSVHKLGGYRVQGRTPLEAERLIRETNMLEEAGADILVLECVPADLAARVNLSASLLTIGIGAGRDVDGQVLVINDLLGITEKPPKFSKNYLEEAESIQSAISRFVRDVKAVAFPSKEHQFS